MSRTCVVTGAASGIGAATAAILVAAGHRVIGVDLTGAEIEADLGSPEGRARMVDRVGELAGGRVDAVIANAGTFGRGEGDVRVNFFGAVATLEGLRPLLAAGDRPRAVTTASTALLLPVDEALVAACLAGAEDTALARVVTGPVHPVTVYGSTKRALARWVRSHAPAPEWAGAGIALNAVAPGVIRTAMTEPLLGDPDGRALLMDSTPMPLGGVAPPEAVGHLIAFLASPEAMAVTGQVIFVDGGADTVLRGDDVWG